MERKSTQLKKAWREFGVKVVVLLLVLFGGYYIFFLAPKLALPNAYIRMQEMFAEHRANLVQNRIALVELARLSPNSADFFNKETELLRQLQETNTNGIKSLEGNQKLPYVAGAPNELLDFLNNDLSAALPPLLLKERQILEEQQPIIASLTNLNLITENLLRYNAADDLGTRDLSLEKKEAATRAKTAKEGIGKISENLNAFEQRSNEIELLQSEIQKTQNILDTFILQLGKGNTQRASGLQKELIQQFAVLKEKALSAQFALIRSDVSVKLLTRQTNLILEYEFWLKKISIYQAKLSTSK